jgi:hypothetical protein
MRKYFLLLLAWFCAPPLFAVPQITVSASAVTLLGVSQTISLTVKLIDPNNTGILRVSGTRIVPIMTAITITPGSTVTVGPIYGNDVILDGFGNLNGTYYQVQVFAVTNGIISTTPAFQNFFAFQGAGTVDLATATPLAPSFMTGTNGSVNVPGALTGTNINGILHLCPTCTYTTVALAEAVLTGDPTHFYEIDADFAYTGVDCPVGYINELFVDRRQIKPVPACGNNVLDLQSQGTGVTRSLLRSTFDPSTIPASTQEVESESIYSAYQGNLQNVSFFEAIGSNTYLTSAVSGGGTSPFLIGIEEHANVNSTGNLAHGPLTAYSGLFGSTIGANATTATGTVAAIRLQSVTLGSGGTAPVNAWGLQFDQNTVASSSNCGLASGNVSTGISGGLCFANDKPSTDSITWAGAGGGPLQIYVNSSNILDLTSFGALGVKIAGPSAGLIENGVSAGSGGMGFPIEQGITSQKPETGAADANVLTVTPAASVGNFRVCFTASVSSATAGVIGWTLSWTDSNGNAQSNIAESLFQQGTAAPALTFTTSAASNYQSCSEIDVNNAAAAIVVKWVGGGTTAAKVSATIERLI